jgi:hypothetical protein
MIPIERAFLVLTVLLLPACERHSDPIAADNAIESNRSGKATEGVTWLPDKASPPSAQRPVAASPPAAELAEVLLEKKDIVVNGEPACALTVRYGDAAAQPVTWRGEGCGKLLIRLSSIDDLRRIGQDIKLDSEIREDLARMKGEKALYVEGSYSSALYPENVMHRIYEVPLAD